MALDNKLELLSEKFNELKRDFKKIKSLFLNVKINQIVHIVHIVQFVIESNCYL